MTAKDDQQALDAMDLLMELHALRGDVRNMRDTANRLEQLLERCYTLVSAILEVDPDADQRHA